MEELEGDRDTDALKRKLVYAGGIVILVYVVAIYGGHKYKMWRIRKRQEQKEGERA